MSCEDKFEFFFVLNHLHQEVSRCLKRHASYLGLSSAELQVLWIAGSAETATLADLARITNCTKEELSEVIDSLERDSLVQEVQAGGSQCTFIQASDKGKRLLSQMFTRPYRCTCPIKKDDHRYQRLVEDCRSFVEELKGRGISDLIANVSHPDNP